LSLHDIPLHLFQNVFTLLKSKPDLLGRDSTSATIEPGDLFHGESFAKAGGPGYTRYSDEYLYQKLGLVRLPQLTRNLPWAKA